MDPAAGDGSGWFNFTIDPMPKYVKFDTPWFRNGAIAYPAGEELLADGFNDQLIADGVAGEIVEREDVAADGGPAASGTGDTPAIPDIPAA